MDEIEREKFMYDLVRNTSIVNEVGMEVLDKIKRSVFWENFQERVIEKMNNDLKVECNKLRLKNRVILREYEKRLREMIAEKEENEAL